MKPKQRRPETAAVRGAADLEKKNGPVGDADLPDVDV